MLRQRQPRKNTPNRSDITDLWKRDQTIDDWVTVYHLDEFPDQITNVRAEAERRLGTIGSETETPRGRLKYNSEAYIVEVQVRNVDAHVTLPTIAGEYRWHDDQPKSVVKGKVETNFNGWAGIATVQHTRLHSNGTFYGLVLRGIGRKYRTHRNSESYPAKWKSQVHKIRAYLDNPPNWGYKPDGRFIVKHGVADWQVWVVKFDDGFWEGIRKLPFELVPEDIIQAVGHDETNRHYKVNKAVVDEDVPDLPF